METIGSLLRVVGAGGEDIPFLGYTEVKDTFPYEDTGVCGDYYALMLVVPDNPYNKRVPAAIGTNLAGQCKANCKAAYGHHYLQRIKMSSAWARAYRSLQACDRFNAKQIHEKTDAKSTAHHAVTVGAHQRVVMWGMTQRPPGSHTMAVLEPCVDIKSSPSLSVTTGLVSLAGGGTKCRVPVEITNLSGRPTVIQPKAKLATLHLASSVTDPFPVQQPPAAVSEERRTTLFNLNETRLTDAQRERAHSLLEKMSYVFAKDSSELGCTDAVEHEIKLSDNTSFKDLHRRVPPDQIEEFRQALQELLTAGVIKESKSPYASPVVLV